MGTAAGGLAAAAPYDAASVAAAQDALTALEGTEVTPVMLCDHRVAREHRGHPVLSREDLCALFDTAPDIKGARRGWRRHRRDAMDPRRRRPDRTGGLAVLAFWAAHGRRARTGP